MGDATSLPTPSVGHPGEVGPVCDVAVGSDGFDRFGSLPDDPVGYLKQGDLSWVRRCSLPSESRRRAGRSEVRASIVMMKRGNARQAKGRRKVNV